MSDYEEGTSFEPPFLSENGRLTVTVGSSFTYAGQTHWPKVSIEDGPLVGFDEEGSPIVEDSDSHIYRTTESVHYILGAVIARMKRDIDERNEFDRASRAAKQPAFSNDAQ
jgi:hypothetical protein